MTKKRVVVPPVKVTKEIRNYHRFCNGIAAQVLKLIEFGNLFSKQDFIHHFYYILDDKVKTVAPEKYEQFMLLSKSAREHLVNNSWKYFLKYKYIKTKIGALRGNFVVNESKWDELVRKF